jgi:hypothetical protein
VALANARLHRWERVQAEERRIANLALLRSMQIHDRLTKVAFGGERQQGIAQAVYELTGRPAAIEDPFGNLLAWAGPGRPDHYPRPTRISGTGSWTRRRPPRARSGKETA